MRSLVITRARQRARQNERALGALGWLPNRERKREREREKEWRYSDEEEVTTGGLL